MTDSSTTPVASIASSSGARTDILTASGSYDAFTSYSHAADLQLAPAAQDTMQRLAKPWHRRRALRIFRDETSLSATPELWPTIEDALNRSRYFIYLASPSAAHSDWVQKEIKHWLSHRLSSDSLHRPYGWRYLVG